MLHNPLPQWVNNYERQTQKKPPLKVVDVVFFTYLSQLQTDRFKVEACANLLKVKTTHRSREKTHKDEDEAASG